MRSDTCSCTCTCATVLPEIKTQLNRMEDILTKYMAFDSKLFLSNLQLPPPVSVTNPLFLPPVSGSNSPFPPPLPPPVSGSNPPLPPSSTNTLPTSSDKVHVLFQSPSPSPITLPPQELYGPPFDQSVFLPPTAPHCLFWCRYTCLPSTGNIHFGQHFAYKLFSLHQTFSTQTSNSLR